MAARSACVRCRSCVDEISGQPKLDPSTVPENLQIAQVSSVGHYAIQVVFSDGHGSGIQTFENLRGPLCQCPSCEQQRSTRWEV